MHLPPLLTHADLARACRTPPAAVWQLRTVGSRRAADFGGCSLAADIERWVRKQPQPNARTACGRHLSN